MRFHDKHTLCACFLGYITQSIINNLPPLLFLIYQQQFGISLEKIGLMVSFNFGIQMVVDLLATRFVDKIGYRVCLTAAHLMCVLGLGSMSFLPFVMDGFTGLLLAAGINALGGGLIEVLISPVVESLPGSGKAGRMSFLHSFYCWGHVAVVVLSTLFFTGLGQERWVLLPILWAVIPLVNMVLFMKVPLYPLVDEGKGYSLRKLFSIKLFWVMLMLMICSGAAEQAMSQWASLFAEEGLGVSKTVGNLLGPCAFAVLMGIARILYGLMGSRLKLRKILAASGLLCIFSYLLSVFAPNPLLSLAGCALCGLSVGILWPGTTSLSASTFPLGGTAMFALLALAGDVGCAVGPGLVGTVSGRVADGSFQTLIRMLGDLSPAQAGLRAGLLCAVAFPLLLLVGIGLLRKKANGAPEEFE